MFSPEMSALRRSVSTEVSKFEAFNVAAEADDATPSMTETQVKHWLSGPKKRDGVNLGEQGRR